MRVLAENKRLPLLPQVHELFLAFKAAQEQSVDLEVTSAFEIAPEQATRLADVIGKKLQRTVRVSTLCRQGSYWWRGHPHGRSGDRRFRARSPCEAIRSNEFLTGIKGNPRCSN
jgi:hypothetical protein